jgi:hypothetical protein
MSVASVEQQDGTINLGADRREIPRRANLLDMLGLSHDLSPATLGPDKFSPPEEDSYSKQLFAWELIRKLVKLTSTRNRHDFRP